MRMKTDSAGTSVPAYFLDNRQSFVYIVPTFALD
jgi:hypothetical protein